MERPFRMWLYPLPALIALVGWGFLYATSGTVTILYSLMVLALGAASYLVWAKLTGRWPFDTAGPRGLR